MRIIVFINIYEKHILYLKYKKKQGEKALSGDSKLTGTKNNIKVTVPASYK